MFVYLLRKNVHLLCLSMADLNGPIPQSLFANKTYTGILSYPTVRNGFWDMLFAPRNSKKVNEKLENFNGFPIRNGAPTPLCCFYTFTSPP